MAVDGLAGSAPLLFSYRRVATDVDTGLIHIPGGAESGTKMVVLNPETAVSYTVEMPSTTLVSGFVQLYGWMWSDLRKSFLLIGGETPGQNNDKMLEYFPVNRTWASLVSFFSATCIPMI